jgi:hypothetical protein
MTKAACRLLLWTPRVLGILVALFIGIFALDVFTEGRPLGETLVALVMHLLPSLVLLAAVTLAWRWEWVGGAVFLILATLYTLTTLDHPTWIPVIAGPLAVVGALFGLAWRHRAELHPRA